MVMDEFDLDAYRAKIDALQEHIFVDLQQRDLGDQDLDLSNNGGIELETLLGDEGVDSWKLTVYLLNAAPLIYTLSNEEGAAILCNRPRQTDK